MKIKIKIKRATTIGLKECKGILFEVNEMQFCLVSADGFYFAIELSTGCSAISFNPCLYSKSEAINEAKDFINKKTKSDWECALNKVSEIYCSKYNFNLPVNEPISI